MSPEMAEKYIGQSGYNNVKCQVWVDTSERINRLSLHGGNSCIVATAKGIIDTVIQVDASKIDTQMNFFK